MKKLALWILCFSICCGVSYSQNPSPNIVAGRYFSEEAESNEFLEIEGNQIFFHVLDANDEYLDRKYSFDIWPNMTIMPQGLTSVEYIKGVGIYSWKLTEQGILRKHIRTKKEVVFVRADKS